ncbi:hypothetical protein TIFTF001_013500 [Ficus carica]|uniref:Uncharacterized protein n=1 Tax=Ficus carica TaxID=3494 RepID=A0AA88A4G6_FICCA|nr:hypothetical protein TIFTF001_013500 [Ficus carica]
MTWRLKAQHITPWGGLTVCESRQVELDAGIGLRRRADGGLCWRSSEAGNLADDEFQKRRQLCNEASIGGEGGSHGCSERRSVVSACIKQTHRVMEASQNVVGRKLKLGRS